MKHAAAWMAALCLGTATLTPTQTHSEGIHMTQDEQAAAARIQTMTTAFHSGDMNGVMESYETGGAVVFQPGQPAANEPEQVREGFGQFFALSPEFTYTNGEDTIVNGDIALHIAPWRMVGQTPDGQEIVQEGLSVAVLRRQPNGDWLMVIDNPFGGRLLAQ